MIIIGVDEAGRGCVAGPVVAAAVTFAPGVLEELAKYIVIRDSKQMTRADRAQSHDAIIASGCRYGLGVVETAVIDEINILQATLRAMKLAIEACRGASNDPCHVLIDGNRLVPNLNLSQETVIRGDSLHLVISAASILAKEHRDRLMETYDAAYPEYGFALHKGYGTKTHREALIAHGLTSLHRAKFCATLLRPRP